MAFVCLIGVGIIARYVPKIEAPGRVVTPANLTINYLLLIVLQHSPPFLTGAKEFNQDILVRAKYPN